MQLTERLLKPKLQVLLQTPHCPVTHVYLKQPVAGEEVGHRLQVCLQFALQVVHSTSAAAETAGQMLQRHESLLPAGLRKAYSRNWAKRHYLR